MWTGTASDLEIEIAGFDLPAMMESALFQERRLNPQVFLMPVAASVHKEDVNQTIVVNRLVEGANRIPNTLFLSCCLPHLTLMRTDSFSIPEAEAFDFDHCH